MTPSVRRAAVIGAGTMGLGIIQTLALAGLDVTFVSSTPSRTKAAVQALERRTNTQVAAGLRPKRALQALDRVQTSPTVTEAVLQADVVFEAVPENLELKLAVLEEASRAVAEDTILTTNTSSLSINQLAEAVQHQQRFVGAHWFNPPEWIPGVEVIPSSHTEPAVVEAVVELLRWLGKSPVEVSDSPGFVANRLQYALFTEALRCVEEGIATPEQVDQAVRTSFGFRLPFYGPFQIADMAGLDIYAAVYDVLKDAHGQRFGRPELLERLAAEGRLGTKSGEGFYDYEGVEVEQLTAWRDHLYAALDNLIREQQTGSALGSLDT